MIIYSSAVEQINSKTKNNESMIQFAKLSNTKYFIDIFSLVDNLINIFCS